MAQRSRTLIILTLKVNDGRIDATR